MTIFFLILFMFLSQPIGSKTLDGVSVIVNKNVKSSPLKVERLIDIYTMNTQNWNDGTSIIVLDIKGDHKAKKIFYKKLGISFKSIQKVWLRKQFSGNGMAPKTFTTIDEIISNVKKTPGAIAYIPSNKVDNDVKVLATIK